MIEAIVSLAVVAIMVTIFASMIGVRAFNQQSLRKTQAAALADEVIAALRQVPFNQLADQTNGPIRYVRYNAGTWQVVADGSNPASHSAPNVLELAGSPVAANLPAGVLQLPPGTLGDVTLEAKWYVAPGSATGWSIGFLLRSQDAANEYRVRFGQNDGAAQVDVDGGVAGVHNVAFEKLSGGAASVPANAYATATLTTGAWYTLRVEASGGGFTVKLDGATLFTVNDATFAAGAAALVGWGGVHAEVDDVQVTTSGPTTWNFDTPVSPAMPVAWIRFGLNDLPDVSPSTPDDNGSLTIAPFPTGSVSSKQATVTISWLRGDTTLSYSLSTLLGKSGVGR